MMKKLSLHNWLIERELNARRLASGKHGEDAAGWLEDADYFKRAAEAAAPAANEAPAPAEPPAVEADAKRLDFLEARRVEANARGFKWDQWGFVTDAPIRAQLDAALRAQSAAVQAAPMVKE